MKRIQLSFSVLAIFIIHSLIGYGCDSNENSHVPDDQSPAGDTSQVYFGDPFVLNEGGTYYMYGTSGSDGIKVYRSEDLKYWEGPVGATEGYALHKKDVWGTRWYWAPEVYEIDGRYYMYFSVEEHIAVAVSESPTGPFIQDNPSVMLEEKAIDNHLFIDEDGQPYIYYVDFTDGLSVWGARMNENLLTMEKETRRELFYQSQEWERSQGIVNEGPYVLPYKDKYYIVYSANDFRSPNYGIGFAYAETPLGNYTKYSNNPIWQKPDDLMGVGHCSFFRDEEGQLYMVYHAHHSKESVHPRKVFINPCEFVPVEGADHQRLQINEPRIVPYVIDNK